MVILNLRQGYFKYVNMIYKSLQQNCLQENHMQGSYDIKGRKLDFTQTDVYFLARVQY